MNFIFVRKYNIKITAIKFSKRHLIEKQSLFYLIQFKNVFNIRCVLSFFYFSLSILFYFVYLVHLLGSFYLHIFLPYEYTFNEKRRQNFDHLYEIQYICDRHKCWSSLRFYVLRDIYRDLYTIYCVKIVNVIIKQMTQLK